MMGYMMITRTWMATVAALVWSASASAAPFYSNDFEGATAEWSGPGVVVPTFGNKYLANTDASGSVAGASITSFTVAAGTELSGASLSLLFGAIDSWDNGGAGWGPDAFKIHLDGAEVFSTVFDNFQNLGPTTGPGIALVSYGTNLLGSSSNFNDAVYSLTVNLGDLSAGTHTLKFFASGPGWQGGSDESFALDNVAVNGTVDVIVGGVPEPQTYGLVLAGLLVVVGLGRRLRLAS